MSHFTPNTETKHPSIAIKHEEDEEEEEDDDFAPTTSQCVESAVTKVTRTVTRTPPVHIHKGDLPNLDHWEYPKSDFDCLFVSFQHAQSVLFEAGTYQVTFVVRLGIRLDRLTLLSGTRRLALSGNRSAGRT